MYGKPAVGRKTNAGWCESISRRATESRSKSGLSAGHRASNDSDRFSRGKPGVGWFGEAAGGKRTREHSNLLRWETVAADEGARREKRTRDGVRDRWRAGDCTGSDRGWHRTSVGARATVQRSKDDEAAAMRTIQRETSRAVFVDRSHAANARELLHTGNCGRRFVRSNCRRAFERG